MAWRESAKDISCRVSWWIASSVGCWRLCLLFLPRPISSREAQFGSGTPSWICSGLGSSARWRVFLCMFYLMRLIKKNKVNELSWRLGCVCVCRHRHCSSCRKWKVHLQCTDILACFGVINGGCCYAISVCGVCAPWKGGGRVSQVHGKVNFAVHVHETTYSTLSTCFSLYLIRVSCVFQSCGWLLERTHLTFLTCFCFLLLLG